MTGSPLAEHLGKELGDTMALLIRAYLVSCETAQVEPEEANARVIDILVELMVPRAFQDYVPSARFRRAEDIGRLVTARLLARRNG